VAGIYIPIRFGLVDVDGTADAAVWPDVIISGITRFGRGRLRERHVCRLGWRDIHGMQARDWAALGETPDVLGSDPDEDPAALEVVDTDRAAQHSLATAARAWSASPWTGLSIACEIVPTSFPDTYGTCHWYVWWYGHWRVRAAIEYPSSAPSRDARFPTWLDDFTRAAGDALGAAEVTTSSSADQAAAWCRVR